MRVTIDEAGQNEHAGQVDEEVPRARGRPDVAVDHVLDAPAADDDRGLRARRAAGHVEEHSAVDVRRRRRLLRLAENRFGRNDESGEHGNDDEKRRDALDRHGANLLEAGLSHAPIDR